jgi:hypothetical protein
VCPFSIRKFNMSKLAGKVAVVTGAPKGARRRQGCGRKALTLARKKRRFACASVCAAVDSSRLASKQPGSAGVSQN